jgi:hypothetical protein
MIGTDNLAQILRIEARCQWGRADQITEHDAQLPPLGLGRRSGGKDGRWWCFGGAERCDRL